MNRVLLIDDNDIILLTYGTVLRKAGFIVDVYNNPVNAIEFFRENEKIIDIVVTDYHMPMKNGLIVKSDIEMISPYKPVILLTGRQDVLNGITKVTNYNNKESEKRWYSDKFGFSDYVNKSWPDAFGELVNAVNECFRRLK